LAGAVLRRRHDVSDRWCVWRLARRGKTRSSQFATEPCRATRDPGWYAAKGGVRIRARAHRRYVCGRRGSGTGWWAARWVEAAAERRATLCPLGLAMGDGNADEDTGPHPPPPPPTPISHGGVCHNTPARNVGVHGRMPLREDMFGRWWRPWRRARKSAWSQGQRCRFRPTSAFEAWPGPTRAPLSVERPRGWSSLNTVVPMGDGDAQRLIAVAQRRESGTRDGLVPAEVAQYPNCARHAGGCIHVNDGEVRRWPCCKAMSRLGRWLDLLLEYLRRPRHYRRRRRRSRHRQLPTRPDLTLMRCGRTTAEIHCACALARRRGDAAFLAARPIPRATRTASSRSRGEGKRDSRCWRLGTRYPRRIARGRIRSRRNATGIAAYGLLCGKRLRAA